MLQLIFLFLDFILPGVQQSCLWCSIRHQGKVDMFSRQRLENRMTDMMENTSKTYKALRMLK